MARDIQVTINQDLWVSIFHSHVQLALSQVICDIPPPSDLFVLCNSCQNWWHQPLVAVAPLVEVAAMEVAAMAPKLVPPEPSLSICHRSRWFATCLNKNPAEPLGFLWVRSGTFSFGPFCDILCQPKRSPSNILPSLTQYPQISFSFLGGFGLRSDQSENRKDK